MEWMKKITAALRTRLHGEVAEEEDDFSFTGEPELNYDRDPFLHSLGTLSPEDIPLSEGDRRRVKEQQRADLMRRAVLVVCVAVFAVSFGMLIDNLLQKQKAAILYEEAAAEFAAAGLDFGFDLDVETGGEAGAVARLRKGKADTVALSLSAAREQGEGDTVSSSGGEYNEELEKLRATLRSYKERNEDVYGYISIPAAGIEYVMVQGDDNDFYLNNNWLGEYLVNGAIFVDYHCQETILQNFNTVIYGHNIIANGGSMFNGVTKFADQEVFNTAKIYIYTMDGVYIYQPFSFYDTNASSGYIRTGFTSKADFAQFAADMQSRSRFTSALTVGEEDRIITLSTCTNIGDGRYALHAVLVDYIN